MTNPNHEMTNKVRRPNDENGRTVDVVPPSVWLEKWPFERRPSFGMGCFLIRLSCKDAV